MIRNKIIEKITKDDFVSFLEIEKLFEENGFEYEGSKVIKLDNYENLIVWGKWNNEAIELINDIIANEAICLQNCQLLIYLIDGKAVDKPIAKRFQNYKTERWMPVVFRKKANVRK